MTKFYTYHQNNSGGCFEHDPVRGIAPYVIIEADSSEDADTRAEIIGLYFNGVEEGVDCPCCGDRWYPAYDNYDVEESPSVYGTPVVFDRPEGVSGPADAFVHYREGNRVEAWNPSADALRLW